MAYLRNLSSLRHLWLEGTNVTNAGLAHIAKINSLEYINLNNTRITDDGLMLLKDLPKLNSIRVMNTGVTKAGLEKFKKLSTGQSIIANRQVDLVQTKQQGHESIESEALQTTSIEPQSLLGKPLPDTNKLDKIGGKDIQQNDDTEPSDRPEKSIPQKSFLTAEQILTEWEKTYGNIQSMKVSYSTRLIHYQPPASDPNAYPLPNFGTLKEWKKGNDFTYVSRMPRMLLKNKKVLWSRLLTARLHGHTGDWILMARFKLGYREGVWKQKMT